MPQKRKTSRSGPLCPAVLSDQATLEAGVSILADRHAGFMATVLGDRDIPALRRRDPGFEGLAAIIVSQQVSTASANAIFGRLKLRLGTIDAATFQAVSDEDLKACGLSAPKLRTLRAIAAAVTSGQLDFAALSLAEAEAAHQVLVTIKGIGPWTADIFLLFCLGHADAWPAGDLALQEGARLALGLADRPNSKELIALGEAWRPLRGVVAHCLWSYYSFARQRAATLEATPAPTPRQTVPKRPASKRASTGRKPVPATKSAARKTRKG